jgi:hypothetical protein
LPSFLLALHCTDKGRRQQKNKDMLMNIFLVDFKYKLLYKISFFGPVVSLGLLAFDRSLVYKAKSQRPPWWFSYTQCLGLRRRQVPGDTMPSILFV